VATPDIEMGNGESDLPLVVFGRDPIPDVLSKPVKKTSTGANGSSLERPSRLCQVLDANFGFQKENILPSSPSSVISDLPAVKAEEACQQPSLMRELPRYSIPKARERHFSREPSRGRSRSPQDWVRRHRDRSRSPSSRDGTDKMRASSQELGIDHYGRATSERRVKDRIPFRMLPEILMSRIWLKDDIRNLTYPPLAPPMKESLLIKDTFLEDVLGARIKSQFCPCAKTQGGVPPYAAFLNSDSQPHLPSTPGEYGVFWTFFRPASLPFPSFPLFVSVGERKHFYAGHYTINARAQVPSDKISECLAIDKREKLLRFYMFETADSLHPTIRAQELLVRAQVCRTETEARSVTLDHLVTRLKDEVVSLKMMNQI
jgi:hypothetical protein